VWAWAKRDGTDVAFDSNGGFVLPNGAMRSPDASWVRRERLVNLTAEQKQKFLPLCPDFVIELRSPSDPLAVIEAFRRAQIENAATFDYTPFLATAVLFVAITIPLARFTDWLIARDRRNQLRGGVR